MPAKLPITLALYLTARGHWGSQTLYRTTLDDLNRQIPLEAFTKVAHIKAAPGEERVAEVLASDLRARGFDRVEVAYAQWSRGQSHLSQYLLDMIKVSQWSEVNDNPFVWACDDDAALVCHQDSLLKVVARMTQLISSSPDILSARFLRREDRNVALDVGEPEGDLFWCRDYNLQQPILRSRDYYRACKVIEDNFTVASQMHIEGLWRDVLAPMSRSERKHAVWLPEYAETVHLGVENYASVCKQLSLNVYPNP